MTSRQNDITPKFSDFFIANFEHFGKILRVISVMESTFSIFSKQTPTTGVFVEIFQNFQHSFSKVNL